MEEEKRPVPNHTWSMLHLKCPRCRRGDLFVYKSAYRNLRLDDMLKMHERCKVCHQKFELETGFWYGTGYVSYVITVLFSVITFLLWWLIIGFSLDDKRLMYWLIFNAVLILALQPFFMRLSRLIFLHFFVKYDENFDKGDGVTFS